MSMIHATTFTSRGPSDDLTADDFDDSQGENLNELGMHATDDADKDEDELDDEKGELIVDANEEDDDTVEDGLKALEALERKMQAERGEIPSGLSDTDD